MGNILKTIRYFKRNGIKRTWYAAAERLFYRDVPLSASESTYEGPIDEDIKFSVLVPVYETPEEYLGEVMNTISKRRGRIKAMEADGNIQNVEAEVPLGEMFGYATTLRSATAGRGNFVMAFKHYDLAPESVVAKFKVK